MYRCVLLYTTALYNCKLPGASLASVLQPITEELQFSYFALIGPPLHPDLNCSVLTTALLPRRTGRGKKEITITNQPQTKVQVKDKVAEYSERASSTAKSKEALYVFLPEEKAQERPEPRHNTCSCKDSPVAQQTCSPEESLHSSPKDSSTSKRKSNSVQC